MALKPLTLQERVKQAQALTQQSTDKLAAEQGLVAPPITAVGTGALGGTPQQQAMAGTPAQKKGALSAAVTGTVKAPQAETGLELAQKVEAPTPVDQAKSQKLQRYSQALGTFGDKVNEWIESAIQTSVAPTGEGAVVPVLELNDAQKKAIDDAKKNLATDADRQKLQDAIDILAGLKEGDKNQAIYDLNTQLGNTTTDALLAGTALAGYWQNVKESIGSQLQTGVQAAITGGDKKLELKDMQDLGTTPEELAELLKLSRDEVLNLTIDGLQSRLAQIQQETFGETQAVTAGIGSALMSETEREALRQVGQQLEEAGIAGAELQYQQLLDDIDQGTRIDLAGKTYTIDELLNTDVFEDIARAFYLGTDKALVETLRKESPDLVTFLEKHSNTLTALIETGAKGADTLIAKNKEFDKKLALVPESTLDRLNLGAEYRVGTVRPIGFDVDSLFTPEKVGVALSDIMKMPDGAAKTEKMNIYSNMLASVPPDDPRYASTIQSIRDAPLTSITPAAASQLVAAMVEYTAAIDPNASDQALADLVFADNTPLSDINAQLTKDKQAASIGLPVSNYWQFDANKDGTLSRDELLKMNQDLVEAPTLNNLGKTGANTLTKSVTEPFTPEQSKMAEIAADGQFDDAEFDNLSLDDMANIFNAFRRPEDAQAAGSPMLAAIRRNYLKKLDEAKVNSYKGLGLQPDGAPIIDMSRAFPSRLSQLEYRLPFYDDTINKLKRLMDEAANPDLRWRYEQDYNRMVSEKDAMKKEMESLGYGQAGSTLEGGIASSAKQAGTALSQGLRTVEKEAANIIPAVAMNVPLTTGFSLNAPIPKPKVPEVSKIKKPKFKR